MILAYVAIADFLSYNGPMEKVRNVAAFNGLLERFWAGCYGTAAVNEIAPRLHDADPMGLWLWTILFVSSPRRASRWGRWGYWIRQDRDRTNP